MMSNRIERVGIVGAGTMGTGIATAFLNISIPVTIVDESPDALARASSAIAHRFPDPERLRLLRTNVRLETLAEADLIIEAVFEDLALKRLLFTHLGALCPIDTLIATNTSTLDVDAIAAELPHPERTLGLHFFSPAHVMKLIEIVRGASTSPQTLDLAREIARRLGKVGIVVGNADGFVGNRMLRVFRRQAEYLLEEGASPAQVDAALTAFGFAMGPFAVSDLAGLDIAYRAEREREKRGIASVHRRSRIPATLVERGRLGQKTGAGYYRYEPGDRTPHSDPVVDEILVLERTALGVFPRTIADEEIQERCLRSLAEEGAAILAEGIAESAADIDAIWVYGYGFPAARGGPMTYAAQLKR